MMTRTEIEQVTGVRAPYLWIQEVTELTDERIECSTFLDPDLPIFQGHYVEFPLFPGALQCESTFQASAILLARVQPVSDSALPVIGKVDKVRFRRLVRPNETLKIEVHILERFGRAFHCRGRVSVDGTTSTKLEFVATEAQLSGNA